MCLRNSNSPEYSITALACCLGMKYGLLLSYILRPKHNTALYSPVAGLSPFPCAPGKATCCASRGAISDTLNCRGAAIGKTGKTEVLPRFGSYTKAKHSLSNVLIYTLGLTWLKYLVATLELRRLALAGTGWLIAPFSSHHKYIFFEHNKGSVSLVKWVPVYRVGIC